MCWEDVTIGTMIGSGEKQITTDGLQQSVVGSNPNRATLMLFPPSSGTLNVSTVPGVTTTTGIRLSASVPPLILTLEEHGTIVQREWFGIGSAAGLSFSVIEGILPASELNKHAGKANA